MAKKFKTIAGYLRSMADDLYAQQGMAEIRSQPRISDDDGYRQIINNLLPQIGVDGRIRWDESPRDGVKRLRAMTVGDRQIKALDDCAKWLGKPKKSGWTVTPGGVSHIRPDNGN